MTDIGNLRLIIGADTSGLDKGVETSTIALNDLSRMGPQVERQLALATAAMNLVGQSAGRIAQPTEVGRRALVSLISTGHSLTSVAPLPILPFIKFGQVITNLMPGFSATTSATERLISRMGFLGGAVESITVPVSRGSRAMATIRPPAEAADRVVGDLTLSLRALGEQAAPVERAITGVDNSLRALFVGGGIVAGAVALLKTIQGYGEGLETLGRNAREAQMDVQEFQQMQQTLFITGKLSAETFAQGVKAVASRLNEATEVENDLSKILDLNNIKYEERDGTLISTNKTLLVAADLIRRAASEQDKIKIAEKFGLPKEFIPALERGSAAIRKISEDSSLVGVSIDQDMVDKAEKFSENWRKFSAKATTYVQGFVNDSVEALRQLERDDVFTKAADAIGSRLQVIFAGLGALLSPGRLGEFPKRLRLSIAEIELQNEALRQNALLRKELGLDEPAAPETKPKEPVTKIPTAASTDTEALQRRLDFLRQSLATEDEAIRFQQERQLKEIDRFNASKLLKEGEYEMLRRQSKDKADKLYNELFFHRFEESTMTEAELLKHRSEKTLADLTIFERNRTDILERGEIARKKIEEKYAQDSRLLRAQQWSAAAGIVDTAMGQISGIIADESEKGFTVMKAIAIATATVKGYEAAVSAWAQGEKLFPGGGAVLAAISLAGTGALIAKIAGIGGGGGGSVPAASAGGGAVAPVGGGGEQSISRTLVVDGLGQNKRYSADDIRLLWRSIEEWRRDGDVVIFN